MAKWSISFDTLKLFKERMCDTGPRSPGDVLAVFSEAAEFRNVILRNNEKTKLKEVNKPNKNKAKGSTCRCVLTSSIPLTFLDSAHAVCHRL